MSPRLSGKTRLFLAGNFLSMLGTGLVLPFMIIYLHQARGIALAVVGALLAAGAAVLPPRPACRLFPRASRRLAPRTRTRWPMRCGNCPVIPRS